MDAVFFVLLRFLQVFVANAAAQAVALVAVFLFQLDKGL
jgi:hypothetical protein